MTEIFTIGHSNHAISGFLHILKKHEIGLLVDIRSDPHSRYAPQFNKREVQRSVESAGIHYRYSGLYIGGKPHNPDLQLPSGATDYDKLAATEEFQNELRAIVELARAGRVVLMCSEADPSGCHRERIVAQVLRSWGVLVTHIMPDGALASVQQGGLFDESSAGNTQETQ